MPNRLESSSGQVITLPVLSVCGFEIIGVKNKWTDLPRARASLQGEWGPLTRARAGGWSAPTARFSLQRHAPGVGRREQDDARLRAMT